MNSLAGRGRRYPAFYRNWTIKGHSSGSRLAGRTLCIIQTHSFNEMKKIYRDDVPSAQRPDAVVVGPLAGWRSSRLSIAARRRGLRKSLTSSPLSPVHSWAASSTRRPRKNLVEEGRPDDGLDAPPASWRTPTLSATSWRKSETVSETEAG